MKKAKKIAIIFAIVLLIGASAFAAVYYLTDIFKTPKDAFYSYIEKAAKLNNNNNYQEMLEELKVSKEKSYKSNTSIGVEFDTNKITDKETKQMANVLKNVKLNINSDVKPSENKSTSEISLNLGGFSAGGLKLVKDGDLYGIKSDLIDSKYIAVENNNLKDLFEKFGAKTSNIPDKIKTIDLYDLLYISKEEQFNLEKTYKNIIKDNIPDENFTKQENVTKRINGEDINTTSYKLSLSEKDLVNVITKVLETAQEDDTLLNIITEKVNKMVDSGLFDNLSTSYSVPSLGKTKKTKIVEKISTSELKQSLKKILNDLKAETSYASNAKAEIIVYAANNDIARIEMKTNDEVRIAADFYNQNDKKHIVLYSLQDSYYTQSPYLDYYRAPRITTELSKIMEMEYKSTKNGDTNVLEASFIMFKNDEQIGKVSIDLTSKGKVGQGTNETSGKISFGVEGSSFAILIDSKVEYTDSVYVESLNESNAQILNNMSKKEIQEMVESFEEGFTEGYENGLSMFGINQKSKQTTKSLIDSDDEEIEENTENTENEDIQEKEEKVEEKLDDKEAEDKLKELNESIEKLEKYRNILSQIDEL